MLGLIPFDHVLPIKLRFKPLGEVVDRSRSLLKAIRLSAKPKGVIVVCVCAETDSRLASWGRGDCDGFL